MPSARDDCFKGDGSLRPAITGFQPNGPVTRGAARAGLAQRTGSRRIGVGPERPAGKGRSERVIVDLRCELGRRDAELGRKIDGRTAAEAVAAARKSFVVPKLVMR
jgi:hypothetical protein